MSLSTPRHVLHYLGYNHDRGGIVATIKALDSVGAFQSTLGVNRGFSAGSGNTLPVQTFPNLAGELISMGEFWRAKTTAKAVKRWLAEDPNRIFHGHSRSGMLVAIWLSFARKDIASRVRCTVHALGRKLWFYRYAKRRLGNRLRWTSPSMATHFGLPAVTWDECTTPALRPLQSPLHRRTLPGETIHVGMAGTFVPIKEWELAIRAWTHLRPEERMRVRFSHIGTTDGTATSSLYAQRLRTRTRDLGASEAFTWLGQAPSPEPLMETCDLWLMPGAREAFGLTAIEALRAGVPVICAKGAGVAGFFRDGRNGWTFKNRDAGDLARVLRERIQAHDASDRVIDDETWQPFSAERVAQRWALFYEDPDALVPSRESASARMRVPVGAARG